VEQWSSDYFADSQLSELFTAVGMAVTIIGRQIEEE
jgi:hypothetical protein